MLLEKTPYDAAEPQTTTVGDRGFKGMDASVDLWALGPGWCNLIQNGLLRRDGSIISRGGFIGQFTTPLAGTIQGLWHVASGGDDYIVFVSGGKLYSSVKDSATYTELRHSSPATSFAFPSSGAGVQMARFGKWLYGVPGDGGGSMFRTNGVTVELLTPAFSFTSTPTITVPTTSLTVGAGAISWTEKFFIGSTVGQRNFGDGTTLDVVWNKSTNATHASQRSKANSDYAIQLDNDTANDQEYVYSDYTGSTDVADNTASLTTFSVENHLHTLEFEAAGSGGSGATPAVDASTPFAYVDAIIIPYSDSGSTEITGGRITKRIGPFSEQEGTQAKLVFDFRGTEERLGASIASYRLRFEQPNTDPSGHAVGAHVNRVYWKSPSRAWNVKQAAVGGTGLAWDVSTGTNPIQDGICYCGGSYVQARDFVSGAITAANNLATRAWRLQVGIKKASGVSAFRVRAWVKVGTSATSTYGTVSVIRSTNTLVVTDDSEFLFFEFAKEGSNKYVLQAGVEVLDDVVIEGGAWGADVKAFSITGCDLTGWLIPGATYSYRYSFRYNSGGLNYEGPATAPVEKEIPAWAGYTAMALPESLIGVNATHMQVWRRGGDATDGWYKVAEVAVSGGSDTTNGYWKLDFGIFEDWTPDEALIAGGTLLSLNRDNPPTNGRVIAASQNRLFVGVGNRIHASWIYDADADAGAGRYWTLSPDYTDPEIAIKGSSFDISSADDPDLINALMPLSVYHPNTVEGVAALTVWRPDSVHLLTGSSPTNFRLAPIVQGEGVGVRRVGAVANVRERLWALTDQGLVEFDGREFKRIGRELDTSAAYLSGKAGRIVWHDEWVAITTFSGLWPVYSLLTDSWSIFTSSASPQSFLSMGPGYFYMAGSGGQLYLGGLGAMSGEGASGDKATPAASYTETEFSVGTRWYGVAEEPLSSQWRSARVSWAGVDMTVSGDGTDQAIAVSVSAENYGKSLAYNCASSSSPPWRNTVTLRNVPRDVFGMGVGLVVYALLTDKQVILHGVSLELTQARARWQKGY